MTKRIERLILHVTVGASIHAVVEEVGKLRVVAVECHGKSSGRIVVAVKHLGNSGTAGLTGIPCLKDGIAYRILGSERNGRTRTVDIDNLLALRLEVLKQIALHCRKLDRLAVAATKSGHAHGHLLAFERRSDSAYEYHNISVTCIGVVVLYHAYVEAEQRRAVAGTIEQLYVVALALLGVKGAGVGVAITLGRVVDERSAVDRKATEAVVGAQLHGIASRLLGLECAHVTRREIGEVDTGGKHRGTTCRLVDGNGESLHGHRLTVA